MRTVSRKRSGVPNERCTPGEASANAPCASSRRKASIWRWMTPRISARSSGVTLSAAAAAENGSSVAMD
jgi:hypothetical protein